MENDLRPIYNLASQWHLGALAQGVANQTGCARRYRLGAVVAGWYGRARSSCGCWRAEPGTRWRAGSAQPCARTIRGWLQHQDTSPERQHWRATRCVSDTWTNPRVDPSRNRDGAG